MIYSHLYHTLSLSAVYLHIALQYTQQKFQNELKKSGNAISHSAAVYSIWLEQDFLRPFAKPTFYQTNPC